MSSPNYQSNSQLIFSAAEEILYTRRFEEGYDLPDPKYEAWLSIHHPIAASDNIAPSPIVGLQGPSIVTPVHVNSTAVSSICLYLLNIYHPF